MGKGLLFKLMSWGIIAGVALVMATQVLNSVSWVIINTRLGNPIPLFLVVSMTLILQRVAVKVDRKSPVVTILLNAAAWSSVIYLFFVILVGLIPYGLLVAISAAGISVIFCAIIRDPSELKEKLSFATDLATAYRGVGFRTGPDRYAILWSYLQRKNLEVLQLPRDSFETVISIIKNRPMLPVVLMHLHLTDFLIVRNTEGTDWVHQVKRVLHEAGILDTINVPPLLRRAILVLPILDEHDGLNITDYVLAMNEKSVQLLIDHRPERMAIYPHTDGIRIVVRQESVPGIEVEQIPTELSERLVIGRESEVLSNFITQIGGEATAY